jgi:hypothetical protein
MLRLKGITAVGATLTARTETKKGNIHEAS